MKKWWKKFSPFLDEWKSDEKKFSPFLDEWKSDEKKLAHTRFEPANLRVISMML